MNGTRARVTGLTGQSGAGKTTVSRVFSQNGFAVIDADIISREVTEKGQPCLSELAEAFGRDILRADGTLDRKKLGSIVFSDREKLRQLNGIIYPYIIYRIISRIDELSEQGERLILLDAPTLFEANADDLCDLIISVTADEDIRLSRITKRDNITPEAAQKRFESQYSEHFFVSHSDFVIKNNKTPDILAAKAEEVAGKIKEYYNAKANG
ncbi:MAG: dephospho-CoA kinase [Oscillospiraceae bacterium]|nr:dephospho-CoA kinase [Oscillospiraceae bacterium]